MDRLRIGLVGAGANTRLRHIPGFQAIEGVSVEVVCNRSLSSARSVAEAFGIGRVAAQWEEVVADPEIDAICIGSWPNLHAPVAIAALEAGKHVLTEARMAMNADEAEAMLAASQNRLDLVAQVVPSPFTLNWDRAIRRLIDSGALGELREISFHKTLSANVDSATPLNWRQNRALSGHNTLMFGIYYEALRRWIGADPERISAHGAIFTAQRLDKESGAMKPVEIPETLTAVAEYESGLRLNCFMTGLELGAGVDRFALSGEKGTLSLDLREGVLRLAVLGEKETVVNPTLEEADDWRVESDFVKSIRTGAPVELTSFADGLAYMRVTDALIASIEADGAWTPIA